MPTLSPNLTPAARAMTLAREHLDAGRTEAALEDVTRDARSRPDDLEAWFNLGQLALSLNRFAEATQAFAEGAARTQAGTATHIQFLILQAQALMEDGRPADSVVCVRTAVAQRIDETQGLALAASLLSQAGLPEEAMPLLERANRRAPSAEIAFGLGGLHKVFGDVDAAEAAYEASARMGERTRRQVMLTHLNLAWLKRWSPDNNHIARLEAMQCRSPLDAACVAYSLFKEYDDIGDTAAAWDALSHGAPLGKSLDPWSAEIEEQIVQAWIVHFPPERFAAQDDRPRPGPRRIFIVGLPRSGTTLVERILTAHSQVQALGELKVFAVATKRQSGSATAPLLDVDTVVAAAKADPLTMAQAYTYDTAYLSDGSAFTIDKLPNNHEYAGLIRLAFPDALIIDVRRNPMDSLFGAYKRLFAHAHVWSYDQDDLAGHYDRYRRLMDHWKACLGDGLIQVSLEAVIANPDTEIRRLLSACGLPFEAACLSPHEAKGAVATASAVQVRRPINAEGIGAWRRYAPQLEPLKQRLVTLGFVDSDGNAI